MANCNKLAPFILCWEGGFAFDKNDLGGKFKNGWLNRINALKYENG